MSGTDDLKVGKSRGADAETFRFPSALKEVSSITTDGTAAPGCPILIYYRDMVAVAWLPFQLHGRF